MCVKNTIGIGIIGCGRTAVKRHIPAYQKNTNAELIGIYDVNTERCKKLAMELGIVAYETLEQLLTDSRIEAVSVCTPNKDHYKVVSAALSKGKHVLCEKPMSLILEECEEMGKRADEMNLKLMICQSQRFIGAHKVAKQLLEEKDIGEVISFTTELSHNGPESRSVDPGMDTWYFKREKSGLGAMADLGVHKTDLMQFMFNTTVEKVFSVSGNLDKRNGEKKIDVEDYAALIYTMKNGIVGTVIVNWINYGTPVNSTVIYGTKGVMKILENNKQDIEIEYKDGRTCVYSLPQNETDGVVQEFVDSIIHNKIPCPSERDVFPAIQAILIGAKSANNKREYYINEEA